VSEVTSSDLDGSADIEVRAAIVKRQIPSCWEGPAQDAGVPKAGRAKTDKYLVVSSVATNTTPRQGDAPKLPGESAARRRVVVTG